MTRQSYWQKHVSRRTAIKGTTIGGAGLAAASLLACNPASQQDRATTSTGSTTTQAQPKRGGLLRTSTSSGVGRLINLDPQVDSPVYSQHLRLIYQGLLGYEPLTREIEPQLAQKWEQPSQTEYIFTLQPGVKFHNKAPVNGRELTVEDIIFSYERARTQNPRFTSASLLTGVKLEAVDKTRIKVTAPEPEAAFLAKLSSDPFLVMAKEALERAGAVSEPGKITTPDNAIGTGAFVITYWEDRVRADYERNPNYWKQGLPYLDKLQTPYLTDHQIAFAAFEGNQLEVAIVPGNGATKFIQQQQQQNKDYKPLWAKETGTVAYMAPNTKVKPLDDARVTRALRLLMDHDEWIKAWSEVYFGGGYYGTFLAPALDTWDLPQEEVKKSIFFQQPKDAAAREAISLLGAAGFNQQNPLKFEIMGRGDTPDGQASAQLLQAQWKRLSGNIVDVNLRMLETAAYQAARGARDYTYSAMSQAASYVEPDAWFKIAYKTNATRNYFGNSDPTLDKMIDDQGRIFDARQRKAAVQDVLRYMLDKSPGIVSAGYYWLNATKPTVRGFKPEVQPQGQAYETIWLDV